MGHPANKERFYERKDSIMSGLRAQAERDCRAPRSGEKCRCGSPAVVVMQYSDWGVMYCDLHCPEDLRAAFGLSKGL
jgi:hypothetical protein